MADSYIRDGAIDRALDLLLQCPEHLRHWEWGRLVYLCHQEIATVPAHTNQARLLTESLINGLTVNRDGSRLATRGPEGQLKLWDPRRLEPLLVCGDSRNVVAAWDFAPDGRQLVVGLADGTSQVIDALSGAPIWSARIGQPAAAEVPDNSAPTRRIIRIHYDIDDHLPIYEATPSRPESVLALAYSPDGRRLVIATGGGPISLRDAAAGAELTNWTHRLPKLTDLWFTPGGSRLIVRSPGIPRA